MPYWKPGPGPNWLMNADGQLIGYSDFRGKVFRIGQQLEASGVEGMTPEDGALSSVPEGGTTGQVLAKGSDADGDAEWTTISGAGLGDVSGPAASVDSELALFSSTTGKVIKRAALTGIIKAASGVASAAVAGTDYLAPAAIGTTVQAYDADLTDHAGAGGAVHANAVASGAAGFMTGTDKAKLDGIEAGAEANPTGAEIVSAIDTELGSSVWQSGGGGGEGGGDALTSGTLAQFAATTSAQLRGVLSDETGTGAAVFGTSPTITTPTLSGVVTASGASITAESAMAANEVNVAVMRNTKTFTTAGAATPVTFSATPTAGQWFGMFATNGETTPLEITIPSSFSLQRQVAITSIVLPGSGSAWITWFYTGSAYQIYGETPVLNDFGAADAPTVNDDETLGYGPGSIKHTTGDVVYLCTDGTEGAANWINLTASGGTVALADITDMSANARTFNAGNYAAMRTALGVAIGSDVQAYSANLAEFAGVNPTAAGLALLDDTDAAAQRTTLSAAARAQTLGLSGFIETPTDKTYVLVQKARFAFTITETACKTASGTCTVTFSIEGTPLGGTANSVTSTEGSQAHASANAVAVGQTLTMTVSSNSSAADLSIDLGGTRTLA